MFASKLCGCSRLDDKQFEADDAAEDHEVHNELLGLPPSA